MSRRNPSPGEILVQLPWQVSATLALLSFAVLRWVLPAVESDNTFFNAFLPALAIIAQEIGGLGPMISTVPSEATTRPSAGKRTIVEDLRAALEQVEEIEADLKK